MSAPSDSSGSALSQAKGSGRSATLQRALDVAVAGIGVAVSSPVMLLAALAVVLDSRGGAIFQQTRMGRGFRPFQLYKFRTMVRNAEAGAPLTHGSSDTRITRAGRFLRRTKLDELPQLFNVLKGDMSLVGPRPELPRYVERFRADYEELLSVRPGITDVASIRYVDEASVLGAAADPERLYVEQILPSKIKMSRDYLARASFWSDLGVLWKTLIASLRGS